MNNLLTMTETNRYKKTALTWARELTARDYAESNGTIYTLEGPAFFQPGDFLCRGIQGELWPVTRERFLYTKEVAGAADAEGFTPYRTNSEVIAVQSLTDFTVPLDNGTLLRGRAGDWLVQGGNDQWIVARDIFEVTYEPVRPKRKRSRKTGE